MFDLDFIIPHVILAVLLILVLVIVFLLYLMVDLLSYERYQYIENDRNWYGNCETKIWYDRDPQENSSKGNTTGALIIREMTESEYAKYCHDRR